MKKIFLSIILLLSILSSITAKDEIKPSWIDGTGFTEFQKAYPDYIFGVGKAKDLNV